MRTARALVLAIPLVACAPSPSDRAPDTAGSVAAVDLAAEERAVRDATQRWASAFRRGDTTALLDVYADSGVWLRAGSIPLLNRDSLRADVIGDPPADSSMQQQETMRVVVAKSGDLAYELGRYFLAPGAKAPPDVVARATGFYVRVWRKQGGQWKLLATAPRAYAPDSADKGRVRGR